MERNPLALTVKEKELGKLVTNALEIKAYVEEKLKEYSVDNYPGDAKQAAQDKAEINKSIKVLNDERIKLEKEWNEPFQEFKTIISETTKMMAEASEKLNVIVKAKEEEEKQAKKQEITAIWNQENFNLVSLDRVFNPKWLNKGTKIKDVEKEIKSIIQTITEDLSSLDSFGQDTDVLKELYLSCLDLQVTLKRAAELKQNREKLAQQKQLEEQEEEDPRPLRLEAAPSTEQEPQQVIVQNTVAQKSEQPVETHCFNVLGAKDVIGIVSAIASDTGLKVIPSITLEGTVRQIEVFKSLLEKNGMGYDKRGIINLQVKRI